jgi:hypothetical protein
MSGSLLLGEDAGTLDIKPGLWCEKLVKNVR